MTGRPLRAERKHALHAGLCAALLCAPVFAAAPALADQCSLFDVAANQLTEGRCSVEYSGDSEILVLAKRRVVFVQSARQGQWAVGTLDGKPAMRYEINRTAYSYATQDLNLFIDLTAE